MLQVNEQTALEHKQRYHDMQDHRTLFVSFVKMIVLFIHQSIQQPDKSMLVMRIRGKKKSVSHLSIIKVEVVVNLDNTKSKWTLVALDALG